MLSDHGTVPLSYFLSSLSYFVDLFKLALVVSCEGAVVENARRTSVVFDAVDPLFVLIHRDLALLHLLNLDRKRP
jgi:hypothetical protein